MAIELKPVTSSNLAAWGYDPLTGLFAAQFNGSTDLHHYEGVPVEVAAGMDEAESVGSYFAKNIKAKFKHIPPVKAGVTTKEAP